MSKFKKKKEEIYRHFYGFSTRYRLMLLFFFMVATVMRDSTHMVANSLPADQIQKLDKKDRDVHLCW